MLESNFRTFVKETIKSWLVVSPEVIQGMKRTQQIWKFKNESDFLYGMLIGMIQGDVDRYYKVTHNGKRPSEDDSREIQEIIESSAKDFRVIIYKE
jgi:hypothetical protein